MKDLDQLVDVVRTVLERQPDQPVVEACVNGADVDTLRSLEGDSVRRSYVSARVTAFVAKRKSITRVLITGGGLRIDVVPVAPNIHVPQRANERLIH